MSLSDKNIALVIVSSVTLGVFLSSMALWQTGLTAIMNVFKNIHVEWLKYYLLVSLLIAIGLALKWRVVLKSYGVKLPYHTLFIYRLIGFAVSYITPVAHVGGESVRALLLKKHKVPLKIAFSASIVDRAIEILFNLLAFFIGSLIILNSSVFPIVARVSIFIISLLLVSLVSILFYLILNQQKVISKILSWFFKKRKNWLTIKKGADDVEYLIESFYRKKKYFFKTLGINCLLWVLMFLEYKLALLMLGYDAGIFAIFLFLTGVGIAYTIPIPAAFGVLELGQISVASILSIPSAIGFGLAIVVRLRDFIWTTIGLVLVIFYRLNAFNLFKKSQVYAEEYNFQNLDLNLIVQEQTKNFKNFKNEKLGKLKNSKKSKLNKLNKLKKK